MFELRLQSDVPIYRQIIDGVRLEVATGRWQPGDEMPSVRRMAQQLRVNPNTVARAYRELEQAAVIETRRGAGTFVAAQANAATQNSRTELVASFAREMIEAASRAEIRDDELMDLVRQLLDEQADPTKPKARERDS